jgi:16S rRNA (guanine1207-N2)-methyltransferase
MPKAPAVTPLLELTLPGKGRGRVDPVLGGLVHIQTARGLAPLTRLMIDHAVNIPVHKGLLAVATNDALAVLALRTLHPDAPAHYFHLDLFHVRQASALAGSSGAALETACCPDLPHYEPAPDLALIQCTKDGETGLTLEWLRQTHARLAVGGKLLATINNPHDRWTREQLERTFGNVTLLAREKHGLLYLAAKKHAVPEPAASAEAPAPREHFRRHIRVEMIGETYEFETCYGVFSSANIDDGSLALLEVMAPAPTGGAVLDMGCGWGALGCIAARRAQARHLTMIDANARAVELAALNAERLGVQGAVVRHEAGLESLGEGPELGHYDVVLSNPPYSTEFRVTELFLRAALLALRPGGHVWMVGKHNPVLSNRMEELFGNVEVLHRRGYEIYHAVRKLGL